VRGLYLPFESGQLSGSSDVYVHEIPGGQYTNLLFQSKQLGLGEQWPEIRKAYAAANILLGDIPKVTPSSKVVGDLAQFMVSQKLTPEEVVEQAEKLPFPESVLEYFQGKIGTPPAGFPEPLTTRILSSRGLDRVDGRPGATLPAYDFDKAESELKETYSEALGEITQQDVLSHALYPNVFNQWQEFKKVYGEVENLPTELFLKPLKEGEEVLLDMESGNRFYVKMLSIPPPDANGCRQVIMEVNGERWFLPITDTKYVEGNVERREKAADDDKGSIGAPTPGVVVTLKVKAGDVVQEGDALLVISAMKMETVLPAARSGVVGRMLVNAGDQVEGGDLLLTITDADPALADRDLADGESALRRLDDRRSRIA